MSFSGRNTGSSVAEGGRRRLPSVACVEKAIIELTDCPRRGDTRRFNRDEATTLDGGEESLAGRPGRYQQNPHDDAQRNADTLIIQELCLFRDSG
jgi:hypothetical protein